MLTAPFAPPATTNKRGSQFLPPVAALSKGPYHAPVQGQKAPSSTVRVYATEVENVRENGDIRLLVHLENPTDETIQVVNARLNFHDAFGYPCGSASGSLAKMGPGDQAVLRAYGKCTGGKLFKTRLEISQS